MAVITVAQNKGGTGKTTLCANLGVALAQAGKRVLLIDLDPQGNLSTTLGIDLEHVPRTIANVLLDGSQGLDSITLSTPYNVEVVPADIDLSATEFLMFSEMGREMLLSKVLQKVSARYDYILCDTPPSLGLLTINALAASDSAIIPLQCSYLAMKGMKRLMETIEKVRANLNPRLKLCGILLTMFDGRTLHAREILEGMQARFADEVFTTVIRRSVRFDDATVAGEPLVLFSATSPHAQAYHELAQEVIARVEAQSSKRG